MKKVLFTATVDSHILQFHIPYLKMFKDNGYEVHVATNGTEEIPYCDVKHVVSFERNPIKANNLKAIKQLKKIINEEKFDIIHCHTPMGSVVTRIAAKKARKNGTKVIYTAHGFHFFKGAPILNWLIFYPIEKYLSRYTDCLITINQEDYDIAKKKFKAKQTELIHGVGVDENKFNFEMSDEEKHELRKSLGLKDDDFVLIQVGELNKNKNQIMSINAMRELVKENSNIHLLLVGQGVLEDFYRNKIEEYGLQNNIHMLGYRDDVPKLMKVSNLGISASQREGLGLNVIEAILSGIPVIAKENRGHKEIIEDNCNGYIINNESELINKVITLKKNEKLYNEIKENSRKTVEKFTLESVIDFVHDIYKKVLGLEEEIRVLHILNKLDMGGTENFIMNVYRNVDRTKIQFDFLVHGVGTFDEEVKSLGGKIFCLSGYVNSIGIRKYKKELTEFIKSHDYKIIHSHVDQTSGLILEVVKENSNAICLAHSHSISNYNNFVIKIYKKILQKKLNKYADIRFACSKEAGKWLYGKNPFIVINNAIDTKKYIYNDNIRNKIRKELEIKNDEFVIGHIGRFESVKNHKFLIDLFKEYNQINTNSKLLLLGNGSLFNQIKEYAEIQGLKNNVIFLGEKKDAYKYYNAMDIFIFPSYKEGLGIVSIEAQANGLTVVSSTGVSKETAVTNNTCFMDLKDIKEWINKIQDISIQNKNRDVKIQDDYNIECTVQKITKIYEEGVKKYES